MVPDCHHDFREDIVERLAELGGIAQEMLVDAVDVLIVAGSDGRPRASQQHHPVVSEVGEIRVVRDDGVPDGIHLRLHMVLQAVLPRLRLDGDEVADQNGNHNILQLDVIVRHVENVRLEVPNQG